MANTTIDTLEVKISATSQSAVASLKNLSNALQKVKTVLSGVDKDGLKASDHIAKSLNEMNSALNTITTNSIKRLQKMANAMNDYADALKRIKASGGVSAAQKSISGVKQALEVQTKGGTATSSSEAADVSTSSGLKKYAEWGKKLSGVFGKVKQAAGSLSKEFKGLNFQIRSSSGGFGKLIKAVGRIALYRAIRSAIKAISKAFEEGLKNAYLYSQQTEGFERLAKTLDRLKSITSQLVNQLGAFWGEFRQFIQPAIEWLIEKVRKLTEFLTELFAGLNGADQYQYAVLEDLKWEDATDSLKKYKHELLGLDELNVLSTQKQKDKDDPLAKFELKPVRESFKAIGSTFKSIKKAINDAFKEIGELAYIPIGMVALGLILLFTGHPLIGIPLLLKGVDWTIQEAKWSNKDSLKKVTKFFKEYKDLIKAGSVAAVAIGAMLLFVPGKRALGLGLILGGVKLKNMVEGKTQFEWKNFLDGKFDTFFNMFKKGSKIAIAIGAMLLFVPGQRALGLGLILGGSILKNLKSDDMKNFSWKNFLDGKFDTYRDMFKKGSPIAIGIGAMLLFVPGMRGLGLGMIAAGITLSALADEQFDFSWGGFRKTVKKKLEEYRSFFKKGGIGAIAIGTMLLFVPGMAGTGIGLIAAGIALDSLADANYDFDFDDLFRNIQQKFQAYVDAFKIGSVAATALGVILLFVPGCEGFGLKLIEMGLPGLFATALSIDFSGIGKKAESAFDQLFKSAEGRMDEFKQKVYELEEALGTDINYDGSIGFPKVNDAPLSSLHNVDNVDDYFAPPDVKTMLDDQISKTFDASQITADNISRLLKQAYDDKNNPMGALIRKYGEDYVKTAVLNLFNGMELDSRDKAILTELFPNVDFRSKKGVWANTKEDIQNMWNTFVYGIKNGVFGETVDWYKDKKHGGGGGGSSFSPNALGGINRPGDYFLAGEAGPEFVGRIGNNSAVANTGQMTDAIYKAAYMGMSQALRENGNGMSGFVPATTDDLFIAMKKKASRYNKATGNPAFA